MEYIREKLPTPELLAQLAEEAAELGHAALKLRRVYDGTNPTPKTYEEALADLHEEIADVRLVLEVLGLTNKPTQTFTMAEKLLRWKKRLQRNGKKREAMHDPARVVQLETELAAALAYIAENKDCATCKHRPQENSQACIAAQYDCCDCENTECVCMVCGPKADKWEWRGAHGEK